MKRRYLSSSLLVALLLCFFASEAAAQSFRPEGVYVRARLGGNLYAGDRDMNADNNLGDFEKGFPSLGLDLGYMKRFLFFNGGVALSYIGGKYENINANFPGTQVPRVDQESSNWRHTLTLDTRIGLNPNGRLDPYVQLGLGGTYGNVFSMSNGNPDDDDESEREVTFTPKAAIGLDLALSPRFGLFVEAASLGQFPDDNTDLSAGLNDDQDDFDVLAFFGGGLRLNLGTPFVPAEVLALDCPTTLDAGESGTFTATVNEEEATPPIEYTWDFGDGTTGTGLVATKRYSETGNYTLTFTAANGDASASQTCAVEIVEPPAPPTIASVSAQPNPATTSESVQFSSSVSGDEPLEYAWDFGDGATGTGANPTHTYDEAGSYTVELTASNDVDSATRSLTLTVEPQIPAICMEITEFNAAFFDNNSSTLTAEARSQLTENLDILSQCPNMNVRVEGFASPGERNPQGLSEDRARAVEQYYQDGGIALSRINSMGMGAPAGMTSKKGAGSQFRRVDSIPVTSGGTGMQNDSGMQDDGMMMEDNGMEMEEDTTGMDAP